MNSRIDPIHGDELPERPEPDPDFAYDDERQRELDERYESQWRKIKGGRMSNYEHRPGSGSAFKNKFKKESKHPSYTGDAMLESGEMVDIAVWPKKTKNGDTWLSFSIKAKTSERQEEKAKPPAGGEAPDFDDSIPFMRIMDEYVY